MQIQATADAPMYMLREDALQPGDIVLSRGRSATSLGIASVTGGEFSHAALLLGSGVYAEAVTRGVRKRSVGTVVAPRLAVMRVHGLPDAERAALAQRVIDVAEHCVSLKYSLLGAVSSLHETTALELRGRLFCSQLVAMAYERAGLPLVIGKQPCNVTPADLAASLRLHDVSVQAVFSPAWVPDYLLDPAFETLSDGEADAAQTIYADVLPWFEQHGLPRPEHMMDMLRVMAHLPAGDLRHELDYHLGTALVGSGYLKLMTRALQESVIPFLAQNKTFDAGTLTRDQAVNACAKLGQRQADLLAQAAGERDDEAQFDELHHATGLGSFDLMARRAQTGAALSAGLADAIAERIALIRGRHSLD